MRGKDLKIEFVSIKSGVWGIMSKKVLLIVPLIGSAIILSMLYVAYSAADHIVVTHELEIQGQTNRLRAYAQGSDFWIGQCSLAQRELQDWIDGPEDYRKRQEIWDNLEKEIEAKTAGLEAVLDMLDDRDPAIKRAEKLEIEKQDREDDEFLQMIHQNYLNARPQAIREYSALVASLSDYIFSQGWRSEFYRPIIERKFRGIDWGTDLSTLPEFQLKRREDNSLLYKRAGSIKEVGDIAVYLVAYSTDLNSKLKRIMISFDAKRSGDISRFLDHELGIKGYLYDVAPDLIGYTWDLENLNIRIILPGDTSFLSISPR